MRKVEERLERLLEKVDAAEQRQILFAAEAQAKQSSGRRWVACVAVATVVVTTATSGLVAHLVVRRQPAPERSVVVDTVRALQLRGYFDSRAPFADADGDGVRDADDFCDDSDFVSGRATDFDGDGCADGGADDLDRDNDGVRDDFDNCPRSIDAVFESNVNSDFDRDGCQDGVEDNDDDGDGVDNPRDACPRTATGAQVDATGCSSAQSAANLAQNWDLIKTRFFFSSFEAFAGALFAALLAYASSAPFLERSRATSRAAATTPASSSPGS